MERTTEKLLTWAPLGFGVALILGGHRRLGFLVALVSPVTAISQHPRATRKALRLVPKAIAKAGKEIGRNVACGTKKTGKSIGWLAS